MGSAIETGGIRRSASTRVLTTCYLRPEQADGLRDMANKHERPVAFLIREAVDRLLEEGLSR